MRRNMVFLFVNLMVLFKILLRMHALRLIKSEDFGLRSCRAQLILEKLTLYLLLLLMVGTAIQILLVIFTLRLLELQLISGIVNFSGTGTRCTSIPFLAV